ncbi:MAG: hypothetical protein ACK5MT_10640 [Actinomycetales bacterium]
MSVVLTAMILTLALSLLVMVSVALPQLRSGKTVLSQGGMDSVDAARRRAAALARIGGDNGAVTFGPEMPTKRNRLRTPIGWTLPQAGPRHAR